MNYRKLAAALLAGHLLGVSPLLADSATPAETPTRILFVGNSFTFYNNGIHTHLRQMLREAEPGRKPAFFLKSLTLSGGRLAQQTAAVESALQTWDWDVVVLQGHSLEAHDPERVPDFLAAAGDLSQRVREAGAEPVLFLTWAYDGRPQMLEAIEQNYRRAAELNAARLVPVGEAFEAALADIPGVTLYNADTRHPSLQGTYLAACTFYSALFGRSGEPLAYNAGLDDELADRLCDSGWRVVNHHE